MYARHYRLISALEVTFWLVLLLLLGITQTDNQDLGTDNLTPDYREVSATELRPTISS